MNEYTLETLIEHNPSFHHQHRVHQSDVDKANRIKLVIESTRNDTMPQVGDIVQYTSKYGDYYAKAHIESVKGGKLNICEQPYTPFIHVAGGQVSTSTSGGAWCNIPSNLERVGVAQKAFCDWGSAGACAGGAFTIYAEVNVWRYVDGSVEFSTENYDKFFVAFHDSPVGVGYRITVTKDSIAQTAFRTEAEYLRWLETFKGVERDSAWANSKIVWTYKQKEGVLTSVTEFASIKGVKGEVMKNGSMRACKHVYEGTTVTTYVLEYRF